MAASVWPMNASTAPNPATPVPRRRGRVAETTPPRAWGFTFVRRAMSPRRTGPRGRADALALRLANTVETKTASRPTAAACLRARGEWAAPVITQEGWV